jgi:hypothetical protein
MNVESAVRESLEVMAGELATPRRRGHHTAMQSGRRRRTVRRLGGVVLGLGVAYGLLLVPAAVTPSIVADGGATEVAVAMIPASVSGQAPGSEVVWLGEIGPEPQFDTSTLGPDLSFVPVDPDVAALEMLEGMGPSERHPDIVVYLGEHEGEPMYLFSIAPPSVWDLLSEYVTGNWSGRIYGTSIDCCGSMATADVPPDGMPGAGSWARTNEAGVIESGGHLQWLALPPDTAVVSLSAGGIDLGWQRPIGRAAMLPLDASHLDDDGLVVNPVMVAYAADGSELARYSPDGEFEPAESTRVLPTLADLSVAHHCNYGFWLGNESGTVGLRLEYDSRAALDQSFPPRETVTLPHPDWDAYLVFGEYLYINWCDDIIEEDEPTPVEDERMEITGGAITWVEAPADDFAAGPSTISAAGLEVTTPVGEVVVLGDVTITNSSFGLSAN